MKPEIISISVRLEEFEDHYKRKGIRTNVSRSKCNPAHIIYSENNSLYSFEAWEAGGKGSYRVDSIGPISNETDAHKFAESELRKIIQDSMK
jgi:hypothetical protein